MQSTLKDLPYESIMRFVNRIRKEFFSVEWPEHAPSIVVELSHDEIEKRLREQGYEGLYLSYQYKGQVVDLRQPVYDFSTGTPMEIHVRTRDVDDGVEVIGHLEASRYEAKTAHINEEGFEWLSEDDLRGLIE